MTTFETDFKLWDKKKIDLGSMNAFFDKWSVNASFENNKKLDEKVTDYANTLEQMKNSFSHFGSFLMQIPLLVALVYWIKEEAGIGENIEKYIRSIDFLLSNKILFLKKNNEVFTLYHLKDQSHHEIIENIRCINELSLLEKEEHVQCYIRFSQSLERATFNYISMGFDPDRQRVLGKEIKYEVFIDFVLNLPSRDGLIAKFLYFGVPSIEEVLNLQFKQVQSPLKQILFKEQTIPFPKHLFLELEKYLINKKGKDLIFTNLRGAVIERSHLNQSFARATSKTKSSIKITPGMLLKMKVT